jgi:membrane protein
MIQAYKNFFKGYADFTGRSTRSDFWWVWLMNSILFLPLYIFWFQMALNDTEETDPILGVAIISVYMILAIVLFTPSLAVKVRRLRDAGFHWAFIFLHFVPMGGLALLVLLAMPTKEVEIVTIDRSEEVETEEVSPFE